MRGGKVVITWKEFVLSTVLWKTLWGKLKTCEECRPLSVLKKSDTEKGGGGYIIQRVIKGGISAVTDVLNDILGCGFDLAVLLQVLLHLLERVDHGGVIAAAEFVADGLRGQLGNFAHDVHGHLARLGNVRGALGRADLVRGDAECARDLLNDFSTVKGVG